MQDHTWLQLAKAHNEILEIPQPATLISDNGVSIVWVGADNFIYKQSIPFLTENELYFLKRLHPLGVVPCAERYDKITIKMENLGFSEQITNIDKFIETKEYIKNILDFVRHGDLTKPHVIVKNNSPFIIDWAESRLKDDPRPDKRPEGDNYWIERTWKEICEQQ